MAKDCYVIDGFCGSGGNVIQFSKYCSEVFAIDIDPKKLDICRNNCKIYNCKDNIHFIEYDFLKIQNYDKIMLNTLNFYLCQQQKRHWLTNQCLFAQQNTQTNQQ